MYSRAIPNAGVAYGILHGAVSLSGVDTEPPALRRELDRVWTED